MSDDLPLPHRPLMPITSGGFVSGLLRKKARPLGDLPQLEGIRLSRLEHTVAGHVASDHRFGRCE